MKNNAPTKILFVVNLNSGIGSARDFRSKLIEAAVGSDFEYLIFETTGENDSRQLRRLLKKYKPATVFAVGGDGTANLVASELAGSNIMMGIIPAGSANGLAFNLGLNKDLGTIMEILNQPLSIQMDGIRVNKKYYCFHLGDIGLNARIVNRFEKEGSKGMLGYGKQFLKEMIKKKTWFSFYIQVPGQPRKKMKAEMVVIANATSYGTGAVINPMGKLDDGKFELVIIRPYPWWFIFTFFYAVFTGKLHRMRYIKVISTSEAQLTMVKPQDFQLDGEIIPDTRHIKAEIVPGAVKILRYPAE